MEIINWLVGPQLLGLIFLLAGLCQKYFPPRHINSYYGYRTPSSIKNQQTWDEGNSYSAQYMIRAGIICLIGGFLLTAILLQIPTPVKIKIVITFLTFTGTAMVTVLMMLTSTEKHLAKKFENNVK